MSHAVAGTLLLWRGRTGHVQICRYCPLHYLWPSITSPDVRPHTDGLLVLWSLPTDLRILLMDLNMLSITCKTLKVQLIRFMDALIKWVRRRLPFFRCTSHRRQSSPGALTMSSQPSMDSSATVAELISLYAESSAEHTNSLRAFFHIGLR